MRFFLAVLMVWVLPFAGSAEDIPGEHVRLPSLVILPSGTDERKQMVADIQHELNRMGCDAGDVTGFWTADGDDALARLSAVRPDTEGVRLSMSLLMFLQQMPVTTCPNVAYCVTGVVGEICESAESREIDLALQSELNRLGCGAGTPDGLWGRNSDSAMTRLAAVKVDVLGKARNLALLEMMVGV